MKDDSYNRGHLWLIKPKAAARLKVPKNRPWLIVQNNDLYVYGNRIVCYVTSILNAEGHTKYPHDTHVLVIEDSENNLDTGSYVACAGLYTITKDDFHKEIGRLSAEYMEKVDAALRIALSLP